MPNDTIEFSFYPSGENPEEQYMELRMEIPTGSTIYAYRDACKAFMKCLTFPESLVDRVFGNED